MPAPRRLRSPALGSALLAWALSTLSLAGPAPLRAQEADLAGLEARYEELFTQALAFDRAQPAYQIQAWGVVFEAAMVLHQARATAQGRSPASTLDDRHAVVEEVLQRWQQARPESAGPDLLRIFQLPSVDAKQAGVLGLLDRYPDDLLLTWQASQLLRDMGETARATELVESFATRNPDKPGTHRLLVEHYGIVDNQTRQLEALGRWAEAVPGDPEMVTFWLAANPPGQNDAATARVLDAFFATEPSGVDSLQACRQVLSNAGPAYRQAGRACLGRLAADPTSSIAEQAAQSLASDAAAAGDIAGMLAALESLEPSARLQAIVSAAEQLPAPERCTERISLLRAASGQLSADDSLDSALSLALRACASQPAAQDLFLELLRGLPPERLAALISGWVVRVNDRWQGELPETTTTILAQRQRQSPSSAELFRALDIAYQVTHQPELRYQLLLGQSNRDPANLDGDQACALAWELIARNDEATARQVLAAQLAKHFHPRVAELLWQSYRQAEESGPAARLAADLMASEDPAGRTMGHILAARSAFLDSDPETGEQEYWAALREDNPDPQVAVEMLVSVASAAGDSSRLGALAQQICARTELGQDRRLPSGCAPGLLRMAGGPEAIAELLQEDHGELPAELTSLRQRAAAAQAAGQPELAEPVLRRILEVDPLSPSGWEGLAAFLAEQKRMAELEELLAQARSTLPRPSSQLLRTVGRARAAAGQPRQAIDALLEARDNLHPGASPAWLLADLQDAYTQLGRQAGEPPQPYRDDGYRDALGLLLGTSGEPDTARAIDLLRQAAGRSDPRAVETLALLHAIGLGVDRNPARTRRLLERATRLGSDSFAHLREEAASFPPAQQLLDLAQQQLEALASSRDAAAAALLASFSYISGAMPLEPERTLQLAQLGAEGGQPEAMRILGDAYLHGRGVPRDVAQGLRWWRQGAEAGNSYCMMFYGHELIGGKTVPRDLDLGVQWVTRAAQAGNPWAIDDLARYYSESYYGQALDLDQAAAWYQLLAQRGDPRARGWLLYHDQPPAP